MTDKATYAKRLNAWADALDSGQFDQCIGHLSIPGTRKSKCPLGVGCHVSGLGKWTNGFYVVSAKDKSDERLPKAVMEYYGLSDPYGSEIMQGGANFGTSVMYPDITAYNSYLGHTFNGLAKIIRNYARTL